MSSQTVTVVHVHTQADEHTIDFAHFMWKTMSELANRPNSLRLTVHCLGSSARDRSKALDYPTRVDVRVVSDKDGGMSGSSAHAACANSALRSTGNGELHCIVDSDTVVLSKGWDDYLRLRLIDGGVGMVGSTYEDVGGFSSGNSPTQTYKGKPTLTWCAMTPLHDWRDLDVTCDKSRLVAIDTPFLSDVYGLPQGYSIFGEVGWQIPMYLHDRGLKSEGWRQLKPTKDAVVLRGLSDYHEEFHADGHAFVAHHRGSMKHRYRSDKMSKLFYAAVDAHLEKERQEEPKWVWNRG